MLQQTSLLRSLFCMIFSRTNLMKAVPGAKFVAASDFEVRLAVAPPKSMEIQDKLNSKTEKKVETFRVE